MDSKERYEIGMKMRREVLGDAYVDRSLANVDEFMEPFNDILTEYCWGGSWGRGVLEKRDRSILNLGMLAALGRNQEFATHFRGALNNGLSREELREVLIQIAVYCGIPAGVEAFRQARAVLAEIDGKSGGDD
ncbi:MAG: carboxymuconolactone decarboxylase family protein [Alphaproteobacteria bacterium]